MEVKTDGFRFYSQAEGVAEEIVNIAADGKVTVNPKYSVDEASRGVLGCGGETHPGGRKGKHE